MRRWLEVLLFLFVSKRIAHKYIDPNTGGLLFQILAVIFSLLSGILLFFSGRIRMAIARVRRHFRENKQTAESNPPSEV